MSERLTWILNNIIRDKKFRAPYKIKNDSDYYDSLKKQYNDFYNCAKHAGADDESLRIIKKYSDKIKKSIRSYFRGELSTSHNIIKNLIKDIKDNSLAVDYVNKSAAIPGKGNEIQFFRGRVSDKVKVFPPKEMLHIPLNIRCKSDSMRFSIPGIPSLYLGNTSYVCWIELRCPHEHDFNVSPVLLDGSQKILNLAVSPWHLWVTRECNADYVHCWLKLIMLMFATSYVIDDDSRKFKTEYIVSQNIMLGCKELGLDGVAYISTRVDDQMFAIAAVNVALFTNYKIGMVYSDICNHIKVDYSYNYSMYKQLKPIDRNPEYAQYYLAHSGLINNIGNFNRQFSYMNTDFCSFDKFLFHTWQNKETIEFGNALSMQE